MTKSSIGLFVVCPSRQRSWRSDRTRYDFARKQKVLQILPDLFLEVDISRLIEMANKRKNRNPPESYANVVKGGTHNLRRRSNEQQGGGRGQPKGGSMSSNSGGQPQGGSMSSNSGPRPSTSTGGSQGSFDTRNKPDENVSYNYCFWSQFMVKYEALSLMTYQEK